MFLDELALKYHSDKGSQHHFYTQYYNLIFEKIRKQPLKILEIGVFFGSSLKMWKEYFYNSIIYGIDIVPACKKIEEDRIEIFIGNQANPLFLKEVKTKINDDLDIIIDDGSHKCEDQISSFYYLFPYIRAGGYYIIEDLMTSYRKLNKKSPIKCTEYLHTLIDDMNFNGKTSCANKKRMVPRLLKQKKLNYNEKNIEYILMFPSLCIIKKLDLNLKIN